MFVPRFNSLVLSTIVIVSAFTLDGVSEDTGWENLTQFEAPEWFRDAKFDIYTHWGPISLAGAESPQEVGWYARNMYDKDAFEYTFHKQHFGDPATFGYKDIIPIFTAEHFNECAFTIEVVR